MRAKNECVICGRPVTPEFKPFFCSQRCADLDLGRWLRGSYAIPAVEDDEGEQAEETPPEDRDKRIH